MDLVWWRTHLRTLADPGVLAQVGSFGDVDELMPFITDGMELPSGGRVLDLGCGRGSFSVRLAQWGYRVTAVEESEPVLEVGREAARRRGVEVEFRRAVLGS